MNEVDDTIREALDAEADKAMLDFTQHETMRGQIRDMMRGTSLRLTIFAYFIMMIETGFCVFTAIRFFRAETTQMQIAWAVGFVIAFIALGAIKLWFWMLANRNAIIREVKRVEIQLARLSEQLSNASTRRDA